MNRMLATTLSLSAAVLTLMGNAYAQIPGQTSNALPSEVIVSLVGFQDADTLYNQGVDAFGKGDYAGAIAKFQAAIGKRPTFTDAHFNLGVSLAAAGKPQDAITEFTWVINKMPPAPKGKLADSLHERGRAYNSLKQVDKALADFQQALALKPDMADVLLDRAAAYYTGQQYEKAIADYTAYLTANPKADALIFNNRGLAYMAKYGQSKADADARAAATDFEKYIAANPTTNVDGYLGLGDAYAAVKDYPKAITNYTSYIAKNPDDAYALGARARANMEVKNFKAAVDDYTRLLAKNPGDTTAKINLGIAQYQSGEHKAAISTLSSTISSSPKASDRPALEALAQAYVSTSDWPNAVKIYDSLLKLDPSNGTAYFNRAVAETKLGQFDKSVGDFQGYLKTNPKDQAPAYSGMGTAYMNLKKYPEAVDAFTRLIALSPKDATGLYNRGAANYNIAIENHDKAAGIKATDDLNAYLRTAPTDKKAIADANKLLSELAGLTGVDPLPAYNAAIAANPKDPDPLVNRGIYYLKQNPPAYDKAIADFTTANTIDPKDATVLYNRAIAYTGKKEWASAIKDCNSALAIKPDYADALVTRADANYNAKTYAAAIADYKQFVSLAKDPKDKAYGLSQIANASASNKDFAGAADAMTQYIAALPSDPDGLLRRGGYYIQLKKNDEAIKDLTDFLGKPAAAGKKPDEVTTAKASGYFFRGLAYANKEDFEKAGADFEQAYTTKPEMSYAIQGAQAYAKLGAKLMDPDAKSASAAYLKAAGLYDKAISAAGAKPSKELADAYYNKAVTLESKYKADESVEDLKGAVEAYTKYLEVGKAITPPITDAPAVQQQIAALKAKIAEG